MNLHVVREKKRLYWPAEMVPSPEGQYTAPGWLNHLVRHPELRIRGEAGYAVDLDAPLEREWCRDQMGYLDPVAGKKGRNKPRKAAEITWPPALAALATLEPEAEEVPVTPAEGSDGSEASEGQGDAEAPESASQAPPVVEGAMFRPYTVATILDRWAGAYMDPGTDAVTHLLPASPDAAPLALDEVAELERPVPLVPEETA